MTGISFAGIHGRIAPLHEYQRTAVRLDGGKTRIAEDLLHQGRIAVALVWYCVGHWDGDYTLVVDTTGVNDQTLLDKGGHPRSVNALIAERYTHVDYDDRLQK